MPQTASPVIAHRYDFVYLFDVTDGNPNGDPDAGNQPRIDPETGEGLITDVCLKRKVRNFVALSRRGADGTPTAGYDIYVKERGILANEQRRAYQAVGAEPGDKPNEDARRWMCERFYDIRTFGAVMTTGKVEDSQSAAARPTRGRVRGKTTGDEPTEAQADADQLAAKPDGKKKRQWNCGQVRGPVQLTFARSVGPILSLEHAITRCALTNATDTGQEAAEGDDAKAATLQMGRKMTVPYGLYRAYGFVSPQLAADTRFTDQDLALLWDAMRRMFEFDRSANRGRMAARGLYVFKHRSPLGNAASHKLQGLIGVTRTNPTAPARSFADFAVAVPTAADLPRGVELLAFDCEAFADEPAVVAGPAP